ncbi:hypothetical protein [Legionella longbeachae]|uniref:hypothetical protein n=1 Tax=Legionella longbeachae TaxID=450 RepID=UPI0001BEC2B1|nr:hypothetical protein [Legionella longbeachae]EEZ94076.1 conserved hypothetical protein [Legionella longbeachae D-4968]QEY52238.1 hypothetical protein FQU71_13945 [Legionella longbeachae]
MKKFRLFALYLLMFWVLGGVLWLIIFGYRASVSTLLASPYSTLSGISIFISTLIASALLFAFKSKTLVDLPYPYFIFGFHIGNLSLLILFIFDAFIRQLIAWKLPEFFLIFLAPFIELFFSYLFGFAFLAIIPAITSAFILYWIQKKQHKLRQ